SGENSNCEYAALSLCTSRRFASLLCARFSADWLYVHRSASGKRPLKSQRSQLREKNRRAPAEDDPRGKGGTTGSIFGRPANGTRYGENRLRQNDPQRRG